MSPIQAVFLDDLGRNLKPARELGMATIKVEDPHSALVELEHLLGVDLTGPGTVFLGMAEELPKSQSKL